MAHRKFQRIISLPLHRSIQDQDLNDVIETAAENNRARTLHRKRNGRTEGRPETRRSFPQTALIQERFLRRVFDAICAAAGLAFLAPVFAMIALAIKLDDGGPVLFFQARVGKGLRIFRLLKFRSMFSSSAGGALLTAPKDARVTRVGRFLRSYKLDELPQLVNVLKGEMQLVGVRPQFERYVDMFPCEYGELLQTPPGITDLASLSFRNEERFFHQGSIEEQYIAKILPIKLEMSLKYSRTRTFLSDLEILFRTVLGLPAPPTAWENTRFDPTIQSLSKAASRNSS